MAKSIFFVAFISTICLTAVAQQTYTNSIGLRYGSVSNVGGAALSYKHFVTNNAAVEGIVTLSEPVAIAGLYQIHQSIASVENLQWYYGGGAYIAFAKPNIGIGVVGNLGLDYKFSSVPINLSLDFKPELAIAPKVGMDFNTFAFSIRYVIQ